VAIGTHILDLLASRIVFVTGKGGTGKTTLSVALARLAASRGRRVVLAEVDNHRPSIPEYFGVPTGWEPVQVAANLAITNITWLEALADWLGTVVPATRIVKMILSNRMVRLFLDVTPGSREIVILARVLALARTHDLVVVDLPASGHAISLFLVPYRALLVFLTGPIRKIATEIVETLRSAGTQVVLVALPEEMVVNETVQTWHALQDLAPELRPGIVFLNQGLEPTLSEGERVLLGRLATRVDLSPLRPDPGDAIGAAEWVLAGLWEADREETTVSARRRIERETGAHAVTVPLLAAGEGHGHLAREVEAVLKGLLEESA